MTLETLSKIFVVKYNGPFGFIKPWTAVRDGETWSQQFLTPSIIKGIELKLFPELLNDINQNPNPIKILRHRLTYESIDIQQEQTQSKAFEIKKKEKIAFRNKSILSRGILINPTLYLAFKEKEDAQIASTQHICLCRNEDILIPEEEILELSVNDFENINGFELIPGNDSESFLVGFNRFNNASPMYGKLHIQGNPLKEECLE